MSNTHLSQHSPQPNALAVIIMGSAADITHCKTIADGLKHFDIACAMHIASAHRTPHHALKVLQHYESIPTPKVYITVAGRSNALSGFTCPQVSSPVIACPPMSEQFAGADIYSSLRMPAGVAPATLIEPMNAALFVAKIFALSDAHIKQKVETFQSQHAEKILSADAKLTQERQQPKLLH